MKVKVESEKAGLKLNIQKTKIMDAEPECIIDGPVLLHADGDIKSWLMLREAHILGRSPRGFWIFLGLLCLPVFCSTVGLSTPPFSFPKNPSWGWQNFTPKYKMHQMSPPTFPAFEDCLLPSWPPQSCLPPAGHAGRWGLAVTPLQLPLQWLVTPGQSSSTLCWWWPGRKDSG